MNEPEKEQDDKLFGSVIFLEEQAPEPWTIREPVYDKDLPSPNESDTELGRIRVTSEMVPSPLMRLKSPSDRRDEYFGGETGRISPIPILDTSIKSVKIFSTSKTISTRRFGSSDSPLSSADMADVESNVSMDIFEDSDQLESDGTYSTMSKDTLSMRSKLDGLKASNKLADTKSEPRSETGNVPNVYHPIPLEDHLFNSKFNSIIQTNDDKLVENNSINNRNMLQPIETYLENPEPKYNQSIDLNQIERPATPIFEDDKFKLKAEVENLSGSNESMNEDTGAGVEYYGHPLKRMDILSETKENADSSSYYNSSSTPATATAEKHVKISNVTSDHKSLNDQVAEFLSAIPFINRPLHETSDAQQKETHKFNQESSAPEQWESFEDEIDSSIGDDKIKSGSGNVGIGEMQKSSTEEGNYESLATLNSSIGSNPNYSDIKDGPLSKEFNSSNNTTETEKVDFGSNANYNETETEKALETKKISQSRPAIDSNNERFSKYFEDSDFELEENKARDLGTNCNNPAVFTNSENIEIIPDLDESRSRDENTWESDKEQAEGIANDNEIVSPVVPLKLDSYEEKKATNLLDAIISTELPEISEHLKKIGVDVDEAFKTLSRNPNLRNNSTEIGDIATELVEDSVNFLMFNSKEILKCQTREEFLNQLINLTNYDESLIQMNQAEAEEPKPTLVSKLDLLTAKTRYADDLLRQLGELISELNEEIVGLTDENNAQRLKIKELLEDKTD